VDAYTLLFPMLFLASEQVADIIENYHREGEQQHQQQQLPAGSMIPPDIFVKLQFGADSQASFVVFRYN